MALTALALPAVALGAARGGQATATVPAVGAEAGWIRAAQRADGAIEPDPEAGRILPYLANYAALGLARAAIELRDPADAVAAWRWLAWYQGHQDAAGFVTDYTVVGGVEISTGSYDSTDAYAGTFLSAAAATWQAYPDAARLRSLTPGIGRAVTAIEATQSADGLTRAKPGYDAQFLMDNAEAYGGLRSAVTLGTALGEAALAARADSDARRLAAGVAALWNRAAGGFDWAVSADRTVSAPRWAVLYPDVMENAWAVAYGLATPAQADSILSHLGRQQPQWAAPGRAAANSASAHPAGYWPLAGWALTLAGRQRPALAAAAAISAAATAAHQAWPYTAGDAGELIALQTGWPGMAPWATPLPVSPRPAGLIAAAAVLTGAAAWCLLRRRRRMTGPRPRQHVVRLPPLTHPVSWSAGRGPDDNPRNNALTAAGCRAAASRARAGPA